MTLPMHYPGTPNFGNTLGFWANSPLTRTPSGSPLQLVPTTPLLSSLDNGTGSPFNSPLPFVLHRSPLEALVPRTPTFLRRSSRLGGQSSNSSSILSSPFIFRSVLVSPTTAVVPGTPNSDKRNSLAATTEVFDNNMLPPESPITRKVKNASRFKSRKSINDENKTHEDQLVPSINEGDSRAVGVMSKSEKTKCKKKCDVKRNLETIMEDPTTASSSSDISRSFSDTFLAIEDSDEDD